MQAEARVLAEELLERAASQREKKEGAGPYMVGIAGVPGAGKSTFAKKLCDELNQLSAESVALVVPMDGFHYTKAQLRAMEDPQEAFKRRGAAWTFDGEALLRLLKKIKQEGEAKAPGWSHETGDPLKDSIEITRSHSIVIVEGNYLLYAEAPWDELAQEFDERWFIACDIERAMGRVLRRHQQEMGLSEQEAQYRIDTNDRPNAKAIQEKLLAQLVDRNISSN
ncbi:Phosphoribulokinase/uridine kinase [Balamuthia mandrillaris]